MPRTSSVIAFFAVFLFCFTGILLAQPPKSKKFGKIEKDLITMTSYEQAPDAGAVILMNNGNAFYDSRPQGLKIVYYYHKRIKILTESAIDDFADMEIRYYEANNLENIEEFKGLVFNVDENGEIVEEKVTKDMIYDEDEDGYFHLRKISFPNVKVGSVIEYRYKITSEPTVYPRTFYFQSAYPTMFAEFIMGEPTGFKLIPNFLGEVVRIDRKQTSYSSGNLTGNQTIYSASNIPALKIEPYVTNIRNFLFRLEYKLATIDLPGLYKDFSVSWENINDNLIENTSFKDPLNPSKSTGELAAQVTADATTPEEKIYLLTNYVKNKYNWSGGYGIYPSKTGKELVQEQEGNGSSLNLMLISLLRATGINADPVLISTRRHGVIQQFSPTSDQFNHLIVLANTHEAKILLDVTEDGFAFDMLPFNDLNGKGMKIAASGPEWIEISPEHDAEEYVKASMKLTPDGKLIGAIDVDSRGYSAAFDRIGLAKENGDQEKAFFKEMILDKMPSGELLSQELEDLKNWDKPLKGKCEVATTDFVNVAGDFIYLQPMLSERMEDNPFESEKRTYPVDFGHKMKSNYMLLLEIPEGYAVEELPQPTRAVLPDRSATFTFNVQSLGQQIQLISTLQVDKAIYAAADYPMIRGLFDLMVQKQGEQIVLKKVSE